MFFFRKGNFAVKRQEGRFSRDASDQTVEQTISKHQKSHGGIMGYSTTPGTVQRWVLPSHIIAHCELQLEEGVLANPHSRTKDIGKSRMNFDKSCVDLLLEVLKGWANPFDHRESLINISSCVEVSHTVQKDLLYDATVGLEEMKRFWDERLKSSEKSIYSPLKKNNLSTFKCIAVKILINSKEKSMIIAAERSLFGRLLILAKSRQSLSLEFFLGNSVQYLGL